MNAIVFKPTGEVRPPKKDEWIYVNGQIYQVRDGRTTNEIIMTRHEIPLDLVERMEKEARHA